MYESQYEQMKKLINDHLTDYLMDGRKKENETVIEAMKYSLEAGGKRTRPILLMASCKMSGGKEEDALEFACALEYIHTYSLIHDDLPAMDDDDLRRGRPTNHKVFGEAAAILAGDGLLNRAYEIMLKEISRCENEAERERRLAAAMIISSAAGYQGMIGGQIADLEGEQLCGGSKGSTDGTDMMRLLEYIHENKTGALMRAAVVAGGLLGGASESLLSDLTYFGNKLGLAFQIADDILDICGDTQKLGKRTGSDIFNGKLTYPSLIGLEEAKKLFLKIHREALYAIEKYGEEAGFLIEQANHLAERTC